MHYEKLADATDSFVSTIYHVLEQLGDAVKSDKGMVKFISEKIRQEIVGMVDRYQELTRSTSDAVAQLANIDLRSRADSALEKWMAKYGAELVDFDGDELSGTLRFDTLLSWGEPRRRTPRGRCSGKTPRTAPQFQVIHVNRRHHRVRTQDLL